MTLNKELVRLAIPNIIANLAIPLLAFVDTALMGHAQGLHLIGAVAIGSTIFSCLYWSFGFLRMGTTGLNSQAYGRQDLKENALILSRSLICAWTIALFLLILQKPLLDLILNIIKASPEVEASATIYYQVRIFAAPATLSLYAVHGWLLGMQNSKTPMYLSILSNILNIILSYSLVKFANLEIAGVAWGTVITQYITLFLALSYIFKKYPLKLSQISKNEVLQKDEIKKFFTVNADIFVRTALLLFCISFFTAKSAEFGDDILAANTILLQLGSIMAYGVDGFAFAAESLTGRFIGEKNLTQLKRLIKLCFAWGIGFGVSFALIYALGNQWIFALFTDKEAIHSVMKPYLIWALLACLINPICFIWDGIFIGATKTKEMRNSMILSTFLVYLPLFFLSLSWQNHGLWLAMTGLNIARGLSLSLYSKSSIK